MHLDFWAGHDDERVLQLVEDGQNLSQERYAAITLVTLECRPVNGSEVTSLTSAEPGITIESANRRLVLELGKTALPAGNYTARLIATSPDQPQGIVFADHQRQGHLAQLTVDITP